jgi:hypothetical protein
MPLPRPMTIYSFSRTSSAAMLTALTETASKQVVKRSKTRALSSAEINPAALIKYNEEAILIAGRQRLYDNMSIIAPMAEAYHFTPADITMMLSVLTCAASGLPLYIIGSAAQVEMIDVLGVKVNLYVLGAAYANFLQNILYAYCFAKAARNFENENKQLLGWSIFWGITTASVPTAAMFNLGLRRDYSLLSTTALSVMTFLSTAPLSFFGIYEAFKRRLFQLADNPLVREYLLAQLTEQVCANDRELSVIKRHNNALVKQLGVSLGVFLAVSQVLSIFPWTCDSEVSLKNIFSVELLAWVLSIGFFNMPNLLIAALFSGFDLGELIVGSSYQTTLYLAGDETYYTTPKETAVNVSLFLIGALSFYFCLYSSVTSYDITVTECPSLGLLDGPILANVNWGTIWGNFALTMISVASMLNVQSPMSSMRDWMRTAPTEEVEAIASEYFPGSEKVWQKAEPNQNRSWRSYLSFHRPSTATVEEIPLLATINTELGNGEHARTNGRK